MESYHGYMLPLKSYQYLLPYLNFAQEQHESIESTMPSP